MKTNERESHWENCLHLSVVEKVEILLPLIANNTIVHLPSLYNDYIGNTQLPTDHRHLVLVRNILLEEGFAEEIQGGKTLRITAFGYEIVEQGGYLAHLERKKNDEIKAKEREELEMDLARSNLLSNRQNRFFSVLNLVFLIANFLFALYTYYEMKSQTNDSSIQEVKEKQDDIQEQSKYVEHQDAIDSIK